MRRLLLAAGLALATAAAAQDYVVTSGRLTDEEFYRLVACGAPPGASCSMPYVRWSLARSDRVTVGLTGPPPGYPPALAAAVATALGRAMAEINDVGAGIRLTSARAKEGAADILVRMMPLSDGEPVRQSNISALEGQPMGAAYVYVWWNGRNEITSAQILVAEDLPIPEVYPVLLEELTQALGFLTDIRNPAYDLESVFAEDSNAVPRLGPQDRAALLRHYPVAN